MKARTVVGRTLLIVVLAGLAISPSAVSGQDNAPAKVSAAAFCDSVTEIPRVECQALVDLYNSTNGASWTNKTGWLSTYTPCKTPWYGVICGSGHVTSLDLDGNNLSGSLPSSLGNLSSLWGMSLWDNQLNGSIPASLGNLSSLQGLYLHSNQLTGSIPSELGNLSRLESLWLSNNQLTGSIPSSLGNLSSARALYLDSNQLSSWIPSTLGNLSELQQLYLSYNNLTRNIPSSLGNLSRLQILQVDHNSLSGALPSSFTNLPLVWFWFDSTSLCEPSAPAFQAWLASISALRRTGVLCAADLCDNVTQIPKAECQALVDLYGATSGTGWERNSGWLATLTPCSWHGVTCSGGHVTRLVLDENNLSGAVPTSLGNLSALEGLYLSFNNLSGSIPSSLGNLSSLRYLNLGSNDLTGSIPTSLGDLSSVRYLDLSMNQLSDSIPSSLGNLSALESLYLDYNNLSGSIPSSLGNLSSLQRLGLAYNNLTGGIPSSLGNLSSLTVLFVNDNPLSGDLPSSLTNLALSWFYFHNTNLCEPPDAAFQAWLASIWTLQRTGVRCATPTPTPTGTPTATSTPTPTSRTPTATTTPTGSRTVTPTSTPTTPTSTPTSSHTITATPTPTGSRTVTPTSTPTTPTPTATYTPAECWDRDVVAAPRVISDSGRYRMWYQGMKQTEAGIVWGIGLAESPDGIHWSKHAGNPVLTVGGEGEWDSLVRMEPEVIKDGGTYKMWFSGSDGGVWQTGYATSPDGVSWSTYAGNPVLAVGGGGSWDAQEADAPAVIKDGSVYKMWYTGCDAFYNACSIGYATSSNGTDWVKHAGNPVLAGTPGEWDEGKITFPAVIKNGDLYEMWYWSGGKIGRATSSNGTLWTKDANNPVLSQGQFGTDVRQPSVLLEGGVYRMWYRQGPNEDSSIGYAESSDGVQWTLWPRGAVLVPCEQYEVYLPVIMKRAVMPCNDEFNGGTLASCWSWVNENPSRWSLTARPGYLRLVTDSGDMGDKNLLLQEAPAGEFEVSTRLLFSPTSDFQMAGIVLWQDDDNYLALGRAYCGLPGPLCVGNGIYFDKMEGGTLGQTKFATATASQSEAHLKVVRRGNDYHGYYSEDGSTWSLIGSHAVGAGVSLSRLGLTAGQDLAGSQIPADFDWFRFSEPLPAADVIFHNGDILPLGGSLAADEAVGIRDGKIWVLGSEQGVMTFNGVKTEVIDLGGHALLPGFVDAHNHVFNRADYWGLGLEAAQQMVLENGITTMASAFTRGQLVDDLKALDGADKLRVRTNLYLSATDACGGLLGDWYKQHPPTDEPGEMLRIAGVKIYLDGGSCGCPAFSFSHPLCGTGDLWFSQTQANTIVSEIHNAGYQVAIHAVGDRAADQALNAIQNALGGQANTQRHRIEHSAILREDQLSRYSQIGIVPVIFANYPCEYGTPLPAPYGSWEWRWRDLLDANPGLSFAWHSDVPGMGPLSPLKSLYSLVTASETSKDGETTCADHAWLTNKTLTLAEGLEMMTSGAAYALFREDEVGSIRLGKYADLVILSTNPATANPESIKDIQVLMTMVGGKVEYCMTGSESLCPGQ